MFGTYAEGAMAEFMKHAQPAIVTKDAYEGWVKKALRPDKYNEILASDGEFPGSYLTTDNGALAVPRIDLGNIVLLPQNAAGKETIRLKFCMERKLLLLMLTLLRICGVSMDLVPMH